MTMYCAQCGERLEIPNTAAFPLGCPKCHGAFFVSNPEMVWKKTAPVCPLCEGTGVGP